MTRLEELSPNNSNYSTQDEYIIKDKIKQTETIEITEIKKEK